ncbi:unnamed protein product, partial [Brachionus calyciflorus]
MSANGDNHGSLNSDPSLGLSQTQFVSYSNQSFIHPNRQDLFAFNNSLGYPNTNLNAVNNSYQNNYNNLNHYGNYYANEHRYLEEKNEVNNQENQKKKSWSNLCDTEFSIDDLFNCLDEISQTSKLEFQSYFIEHNKEKLEVKSMKNRIRTLRDKLFKIYLKKLNYKPNSLTPKEKTCVDMLGDIHIVAVCFLDETVSINLLDLFNGSDNNLINEIDYLLSKQQETIFNKIEQENTKINVRISHLEKNLNILYSSLNTNRTELYKGLESIKHEINFLKDNNLDQMNSNPQVKKRKLADDSKKEESKSETITNIVSEATESKQIVNQSEKKSSEDNDKAKSSSICDPQVPQPLSTKQNNTDINQTAEN